MDDDALMESFRHRLLFADGCALETASGYLFDLRGLQTFLNKRGGKLATAGAQEYPIISPILANARASSSVCRVLSRRFMVTRQIKTMARICQISALAEYDSFLLFCNFGGEIVLRRQRRRFARQIIGADNRTFIATNADNGKRRGKTQLIIGHLHYNNPLARD